MPDCEQNTTPGDDAASMEHVHTWGISLAFWSCLLLAAILYGTVALSPKLAAWLQVRHQHATNAARLIRLDAHVEYLERVNNALQTDSAFAQRLADAGDSNAAGSDVVPVSPSLVFGSEDNGLASADEPVTMPRGTTAIAWLAQQTQVRTAALAMAVLLTVFGFTFLNDSDTRWIGSICRGGTNLAAAMIHRYRSASPDGNGDDAVTDPSNEATVEQDSTQQGGIPR